jgi:hypothetical protein
MNANGAIRETNNWPAKHKDSYHYKPYNLYTTIEIILQTTTPTLIGVCHGLHIARCQNICNTHSGYKSYDRKLVFCQSHHNDREHIATFPPDAL